MKLGLRKLTVREHVLSASLLVCALTIITADVVLPEAARFRSSGHLIMASNLSVLPALALVAGLLALLPRTGNDSRYAFFKLLGRLPLLVRYILVGLLVIGLAATIKLFGS